MIQKSKTKTGTLEVTYFKCNLYCFFYRNSKRRFCFSQNMTSLILLSMLSVLGKPNKLPSRHTYCSLSIRSPVLSGKISRMEGVYVTVKHSEWAEDE